MALRLQSRLIHQYSCIGVQPRKRETDVRVDQSDLRRRDARVLQFHGRTLFAPQHDDVSPFNPDGAGAAFYGFQGVFNLEDVAVGTGERGTLLV